jgi:hypothetical protein
MGATFVNRFVFEPNQNKMVKYFILAFTIVSITGSLKESFFTAYPYGLKDTRTIAKEWIEKNLPPQSKIIMDLLPYSPPLNMAKNQLEKFYNQAVLINHYKKDYFRMKLEVYDPNSIGYEIVLMKRSAQEVGSLPTQVEQVQKMQDLIEIRGDESDLKSLKKEGIEYVVTNSWAANVQTSNLKNFYKILSERFRPEQTFAPKNSYHPGPVIKIYKILQ